MLVVEGTILGLHEKQFRDSTGATRTSVEIDVMAEDDRFPQSVTADPNQVDEWKMKKGDDVRLAVRLFTGISKKGAAYSTFRLVAVLE